MTSDRTILITGVTGNQSGGGRAGAAEQRVPSARPDAQAGERQAAALAREAGVQHYVYTSAGSAHKRTGIPHFDNKWRIEEAVRGLRLPSHVILRAVFFMEYLLAPYSHQGSTVAWALGPGLKLQMIAVDDIAGLEREVGRALTKLPDWARHHTRAGGQTRGGRA